MKTFWAVVTKRENNRVIYSYVSEPYLMENRPADRSLLIDGGGAISKTWFDFKKEAEAARSEALKQGGAA